MNFRELRTSLTGEIGIIVKQGDVTYPNLGKKISTIMDVFFKQPNSKKKQIITVLFYEKKYFYTLNSVLLITKNWCCFCSNIMNMFFFHF